MFHVWILYHHYVSDVALAVLAPVIVYWVVSAIFHSSIVPGLPSTFEPHRKLHDAAEISSRNKVTIIEVIKSCFISTKSFKPFYDYFVLEDAIPIPTSALRIRALDFYAVWLESSDSIWLRIGAM